MATSQVFKIQSKTYSADDLIQEARAELGSLVDVRVQTIAEDIEKALYTFILEMEHNSAEPRTRGIISSRPGSTVKTREAAYKNLLVNIEYENRLVARGRYTGKSISTALLSVYSPNLGFRNAFNAMDTGIPARSAHGKKPMRFPRYEGNMIGRTGAISPVRTVRTGSSRSDQTKGNWVTARSVGPSEPFDLMKRIRLVVRRSENQLNRVLDSNNILDLSKIKIKIIPQSG